MNKIFVPTPKTTAFRIKARMNERKWTTLLQTIMQDLRNPCYKILAEGFNVHGQVWEDHLDDYLLDGLAERYWGRGTREIWSLQASEDEPDRAMIRMFVREVVEYIVPRNPDIYNENSSLDVTIGSQLGAKEPRISESKKAPRKRVRQFPAIASLNPAQDSSAAKRRALSSPLTFDSKDRVEDTPTRGSSRVAEKDKTGGVSTRNSPRVGITAERGGIGDLSAESPHVGNHVGNVSDMNCKVPDILGSSMLRHMLVARAIEVNPESHAVVFDTSKKVSPPMPGKKQSLDALGIAMDVSPNDEPGKEPTMVQQNKNPITGASSSLIPTSSVPTFAQSKRPALTLQTIITSTNPPISHFMRVPEGFTLTDFLNVFSTKHRLSPSQVEGIATISVHLQNTVLSIDLGDSDRAWDWEAWMELFGNKGGLVQVTVHML